MFKMSIKRFLCMSVATSSTLIAAEVVRIEAANYNLYPKPGSLKCEVGKTEVIQERPDSKDIKVVIKISGEMASVNSGQIVLERIPSYDFTDKGIEARFKLSQIVRKIYSADAITQGSFLSSLPNIDATLRAKIVPFEFITEATKVFAPGSNTDRVYYLPISVNFLTACVLELDQTKGEFKSFQPSQVFCRRTLTRSLMPR
ncbi:MAG: hypothetical protein NTV34_12490 [Proteobacteria bacterium]|nr:hypothetical protein [Pseudomonadota bacterium]